VVLHTRRRAFRLPAGEGALTRLTRVESVLEQMKDGREPSKRAVARCLKEYHGLLQALWLWGFRKK